MTDLQRKICLLGAAGVGKTSLVRRFVEGIFDERYLSTIGVRIDRRVVELQGVTLNLMLWDIEGESELRTLRARHLRGASAALFVVDGTRPETLTVARELRRKSVEWIPGLPCLSLLNKSDLVDRWALPAAELADLGEPGVGVFRTSARTAEGVERAFLTLARRLLPAAS